MLCLDDDVGVFEVPNGQNKRRKRLYLKKVSLNDDWLQAPERRLMSRKAAANVTLFSELRKECQNIYIIFCGMKQN